MKNLIGLDTSCVVALLCGWHERHRDTVAALRIIAPERVVICANVILESFAVLTRLPAPYRLAASQTEELLESNFREARIVSVVGPDCRLAMAAVARMASRGGKVYDAAIAHSTARAGAATILTWNVKDFVTVAPPELRVIEPTAE
ncbi:MAG: PIN domain-containing protein [Acidobacteria bacterium]|nr:PIN domain-containing protein [Acidobacteriota bacterium]